MRSLETRGQEVKGNSGGRCNWGSASFFFQQKKYKWNECGKMSLITQVNTGGSSAANENIRIFLAFFLMHSVAELLPFFLKQNEKSIFQRGNERDNLTFPLTSFVFSPKYSR